MKTGKIHIGKIRMQDVLSSYRKASREIELEINGGWTAKHKVHKSKKNYTRKAKHKKNLS